MYLEISPRGTGKTYRLIKDAVKELDQGNEIFIVTTNVKTIQNMLSKSDKCVITNNPKEVYLASDISKKYFEEFDYFDDLTPTLIKKFNLYKNCYYTTSPSKIRDISNIDYNKDSLFHLIKMNDGHYHSYNYYHYTNKTFLKECRSSMSKLKFDIEYLARFYE